MNNSKLIITRTPFRISFFGGGTDFPEYFNNHNGAVLGTTIDKYCYVTINSLERLFDKRIRLSYSKMETATHIKDIKDNYFRTILMNNINLYKNDYLDIHTYADLPASTGLGSSSTFIIGMLNALYSLKGIYKSPKDLANEAIKIERVDLKEKGGWQDQIFASVGGFNCIHFNSNDFLIEPLPIKNIVLEQIENSSMLFFTNMKRSSDSIQRKVMEKRNKNNREQYLKHIYELYETGKDLLLSSDDPLKTVKEFGELLNKGWIAKKSLADNISNPEIDKIYNKALSAGAYGGKVCGAGGGGFLYLVVPIKKQSRVLEALKTLKRITFKFERNGSKVIFID